MNPDRPQRFIRCGLSCLAAILLALVGIAFVADANFPGYMNPDAIIQLRQAIDGRFDDWHSPFMSLLWRGLLHLAPGPIGLMLFDAVMIWGSLATLAILTARRSGGWSLLLLGLPLLPGTFNYLGNVHVDTLLVAWLLAALALILPADRADPPDRYRTPARILANLALLCGFLTRPNAVFCLIPLLLLANRRLGARRMLQVTAGMVLAMPLVLLGQNRIVHSERLHPADSIKTYELLALSSYEQQVLLPGSWTPEQAHRITNSCYTPVQWDPAEYGGCRYIVDTLKQTGLWGSPALTRAWIGAALHHPLGLATMLLQPFRIALFDPNSPSMFYPTSNRWGWAVADDPPRAASALSQHYVDWPLARFFGRPVCFVVLSSLTLVVLLRSGAAATAEGRLAMAVLCSGLTYLLSFLPMLVSAEYRYFYWCGFCTYGGVILTGLAIVARRRASSPDAAADIPPTIRLGGQFLASASLALVTVCAFTTLPPSRRTITLTPLDHHAVRLDAIRDANVLFWRLRNFPDIVRGSWSRPGGYVGDDTRGPLTAITAGLNDDLEILFSTVPGAGRVRIATDGFDHVVDTGSPAPGALSVIVPSRPADPPDMTASLVAVFALIATCLLWLVVLRLASRPRPAGPCPG